MTNTTANEVAGFQRLPAHLDKSARAGQDLVLTIWTRIGPDGLAASWRTGSPAPAGAMDCKHSRQRAFGLPYARWKGQPWRRATSRHMRALDAAQARRG